MLTYECKKQRDPELPAEHTIVTEINMLPACRLRSCNARPCSGGTMSIASLEDTGRDAVFTVVVDGREKPSRNNSSISKYTCITIIRVRSTYRFDKTVAELHSRVRPILDKSCHRLTLPISGWEKRTWRTATLLIHHKRVV